jgi:hypothetical protein
MRAWRSLLLVSLAIAAPATRAADVLFLPEPGELRGFAASTVLSEACDLDPLCVYSDFQDDVATGFSSAAFEVESAAGRSGLAIAYSSAVGSVFLDIDGDRLRGGSMLVFASSSGGIAVPYEVASVDVGLSAGAEAVIFFVPDAPVTLRVYGAAALVAPITPFLGLFDGAELGLDLRGASTLFARDEQTPGEFDSGPIPLEPGQTHTLAAHVAPSVDFFGNEGQPGRVGELLETAGEIELWFEVPEPAAGGVVATLTLLGLARRRAQPIRALCPPSTASETPVMKRASSEARNSAA